MIYQCADPVNDYFCNRARLAITATLAEHRACIFLARHGQRFLSDFGIQNAREKAQALRRGDRLRKRSLAGQPSKSKKRNSRPTAERMTR